MLSKAGLQHLAKHLNPSSQIVMRADFNVPIKQGKVADPNRIKATIPTIQELLKHNPKSLVLLSHLGRPNGKKNQKHSLRPVLDHLSQYLNRKVTFLDDCVGNSVIDQVQKSSNEVFLCQNVRFHVQEEGSHKDNDGKKIKANPESIKQFRNQLSQLGNFYVNDAFGTAHRAHSSVVGIAHKYRVAGLLMQKEISYLGEFLQKPKKPVLVIMGGAKVADKINLIKNMIHLADEIIIGGGMKNPFLQQVYGIKLGKSKVFMPENPQILHQILDYGKQNNCKIHFPIDYVLGKQLQTGTETMYWQDWQKDIPSEFRVLDCGPKSSQKIDEIISRAQSIFWNGPFGYIEAKQFRQGSQNILKSIIKQTKNGATSIIGGGDSASLVNNMGLSKEVSYVSTGGGATLELLEGKVLPGIKGLSEKSQL